MRSSVERKTGKDAGGDPIYTATSLTPILDDLIRVAQVRNVFGCHFNTLSFELLEADGLLFGQKVLELMDALVQRT